MNIPVINPITLEKLYEIKEATDNEIEQVYSNARTVQAKIQTMSVTHS